MRVASSQTECFLCSVPLEVMAWTFSISIKEWKDTVFYLDQTPRLSRDEVPHVRQT